MTPSRVTGLSTALLVAAGLQLGVAEISPASVVRPFQERFTINTTGEIVIIGNTLETCPTSDSRCAAATSGTISYNNNDFDMVYVDIDSDPGTFNSSRAILSLDPDVEVLWAGLYWGGDQTAGISTGAPPPDVLASDQVLFLTPALPSYVGITAQQLDSRTDPSPERGTDYQGFADVTALVRLAGAGEYGVANVQAGTGANRNAGWALVLVLSDSSEPLRNLTVFDGFAFITPSDPALSIVATDFLTPLTGMVQARVGMVVFEGDRNFVGDNFRVDGVLISNSLNPPDNIFNSSATAFEVRFDQKTPDFVNQLAIDFDIFRAFDILPNGATSATLTFATQLDAYYPGVLTFSTILFSPVLTAVKSVTDPNGGDAMPGDVLEYEIAVTNDGVDTAEDVVLTDELPEHTSFVPGSLEIVSGAGSGSKTDTPSDDQAEVTSDGRTVRFRLGTGANGTTGGSLALTASTTVRFRVAIDPSAANGLEITNRAGIAARGATLGETVETVSNPVTTIVVAPGLPPQADLQVSKSADPESILLGELTAFEIVVTNLGPDAATSVRLIDSADFGLEAIEVQPDDVCTLSGGVAVCEVSVLQPNESFSLLMSSIGRDVGGFTNRASVSAMEPDPDLGNNEASASVLVQPLPATSIPVSLPGLVLLAALLAVLGARRLS